MVLEAARFQMSRSEDSFSKWVETLDYEAYGAGYVAAVAYHSQLSGRVNLWKGFKG